MLSKTITPFLAVMLSCLLFAGCGGGGSSSGGDSEGNGAGGGNGGSFSTDIEGTVAKGIVKNGQVSLYAIDDRSMGNALATASTDDKGHYALNYTGDYQGSAFVRLSVNSGGQPTLMTCDIKPDCGAGISFGQDFELEKEFDLFAVVAALGGGPLNINITALTDLAASYVIDKRETSAEQVNAANARVAELFGLTDSILIIPAIDISKADALTSASNISAKNALFSAAILGALQENTEIALYEKLRRLRQFYIKKNGDFPVGDESVDAVSIFEIIDIAEDLAEQLGVKKQVLAEIHSFKSSVDSDKDGLGDLLDAFPHDPRIKHDKDQDGVAAIDDACDDDPMGFVDSDEDRVCDESDAFPDDKNEWADSDQDGVGDNTDNCPDAANSEQNNTGDSPCGDSDDDGVIDSLDNCPLIANSDQANNSGTNAGDACEDSDADSVPDLDDNCPDVANEDQTDFVGSLTAAGDACEDSDGDGVLDIDDLEPLNDQVSADTDGDGVDNLFDVFPDDPTRWDPSPYIGSYRLIYNDLELSPEVIVPKNGRVVWSFLGQTVVFDIPNNGVIYKQEGSRTIEGQVYETGTIWVTYRDAISNVYVYLSGYKISPFVGTYNVSADGVMAGKTQTFKVTVKGVLTWVIENSENVVSPAFDGRFLFTDDFERSYSGQINADGTVTGTYQSGEDSGNFSGAKF